MSMGTPGGVGGCSSVFRGLARQAHNDMCRYRLRGILKEGAKVRNAEGRQQDFEKKELENKRKKDERKVEEQDKRSRIEVPQRGASNSTDMSVDPVGPVLVTSPAGEDNMSVDEFSRLVEVWVNEVWHAGEGGEDEENMQIMEEAWDDVHGGELPIWEVKLQGGKR